MPEFDSTVEYRPVKGFPAYRIGNDGSIWSCFKQVGRGPRIIGTNWKKLKPTPADHVERYIHLLVLEEFVGPCPDGMEACHFPYRDVTNNSVSNLRWDTHCADRTVHGTSTNGERNGVVKLTEASVLAMRAEYDSGQTSRKYLAEKYGVSAAHVWLIIKRKSWKYLP